MNRDEQRELRRLVTRWRSRSDLFSEDDDVAKRCAEMCADELEEFVEDHADE